MSHASSNSQPSLNFVEAGVGAQARTAGADPFGYTLAASFELNDSWYIPLSYFKFEENERLRSQNLRQVENAIIVNEIFNENTDFAISEFTAGLGYKLPVNKQSFFCF